MQPTAEPCLMPATARASSSGEDIVLHPGTGSTAAWVRALRAVRDAEQTPFVPLPEQILLWGQQRGAHPAIEAPEGQLSYAELAARQTDIADWANAQGIGPGTIAALFLGNTLGYIPTWLGLLAAGAKIALINNNLSGDMLRHALSEAGVTHVLTEEALWPALAAILPEMPHPPACWRTGMHAPQPLAPGPAAAPLPRARRRAAAKDTALYIFTSGTTGFAKAVPITHLRLRSWGAWFAGMMDLTAQDRLYDCLPLYHSTGGIAFPVATLAGGGTLVLRRRFSSRRFWADIAETRCTIFAYIGELCRYLAYAPPQRAELRHHLRLCCGNGLAGSVWPDFRNRFNLPQIIEFYAATEGVVSLYNLEQREGAVGRVPPFLAHRFPVALVRITQDGAIARDPQGRAMRCAPDEIGELLGGLTKAAQPRANNFPGYTNEDATSRKLAHNVFTEHDVWFRTGDLMRQDDAGFFYFVDRLGDAFRYKGENISAQEVAEALRRCEGVADAVAYGIPIPGEEGRAGMAAIVPGPLFDLATLRAEIAARLPPYARPRYLRLCETLHRTGTFKPMTASLQAEGYDITRVTDPLYADDPRADAYVAVPRPLG